MPRLSVKILLTTIVGLLTAAGAPAASSVSVIWRDTGTALIGPSTSPSAVASSVILGDIVLTADSVAIFTFVVSIQFDPTELQAVGGGASELPVVDLPGMGNQFSPLVPGITLVDNTSGVIEGFDQITVATGLANATRTLGSLRFHVVSPSGGPGEDDVIVSLQNLGVDGIFGPGGASIVDFVGADVVPEPTIAGLVLIGLAGLFYASRR